MSILDGLNPQQAAAVAHRHGPAVVIAGPGAGKTRVLTARAAALLQEGVKPERILLLTFTRAAANTMMARARSADERAEFLTAGTFHSWGIRILNANAHVFGLEKEFTMLDQADVAEIVKRAMEPLKGEKNWPRATTVAKIISYSTNTRIPIAEVIERKYSDYINLAEEIEQVRDSLVGMKIDKGLIDYDDVLTYLAMLLEDDDIGQKIRDQYDYVMVDEYQDTNALQLAIVHGLVGDGGNVMIVGDPCQPADTKVSKVVKNGREGGRTIAHRVIENVPISEIQEGDKIVGYSLSDSTFFLNRTVDGVTKRPYEGELIKAQMEDGRASEYTPNHLCLVNYKSLEDHIGVYLMRSGNRFRIGKAKMGYKITGKTSGSGPFARAKAEGADELWILDTYVNEQDAVIAEINAQVMFGLPSLTFVSGYCKGGRVLDEEHMARCWTDLDSIDMTDRAMKCLDHFGRRLEHPLWTREGYSSLKRPLITAACNILEGTLMLPFNRETQTHIKKTQWKPVEVSRRHYSGFVYSLSVSHDSIYVADGIATHNCQSIYGFRGGAPATMQAFKKEFASATVLPLEINYRSTPEIIELVNAIDGRMDIGFERTLHAGRPSGKRPVIVDVADNAAEAVAIADTILADKANGGEISDHAVLVRSTAAARRIETEFISRNIPHTVKGGVRIDEAAHIKDLLSIARISVNIGHEPAWLRMLSRFRKIGAKAAESIAARTTSAFTIDEACSILREEGEKRRTELGTLAEAIEAIAGNPLVAEGLEAVISIMRPIWASVWDEDWNSRERDLEAVLLIAEEHPTMEGFLTTITLDASMDRDRTGAREKTEEDPVTISTIHSAKGLEWKHVHIPAFVQGGMPSLFAQNEEDHSEELRVAYVAVSRAEKTLTLYRPRFNGQGNFTSPSEYDVLFKPYVDQETRARKMQDGSGGRIETTKKIDLKARMLGKG